MAPAVPFSFAIATPGFFSGYKVEKLSVLTGSTLASVNPQLQECLAKISFLHGLSTTITVEATPAVAMSDQE